MSGLFVEKQFRPGGSRPPIRRSNRTHRLGMTKALGKMCPKQQQKIHHAEGPDRGLGLAENGETGVDEHILGISTSSMVESGLLDVDFRENSEFNGPMSRTV